MSAPASEQEAFRRHARHLSPAFVRLLDLWGFGRLFVRARGTRVWDAEGREYLDFLSGYGAVSLGYNHPELLSAARGCLDAERPSFLQLGPALEAGLLAEALAERLGPELSVAFFCNSGTEAVEGALKLAFASTRRTKVLYCRGAYHGLTLGALSLMGSERLRAPFPSLPGCEMLELGELVLAEAKLRTRRYAAFVIEPIQAESGVRLPAPEYLAELALLCRRYGTLLIFDEVQSGMGRTGQLFAFQGLGVTPDVLCYAKGFGGGLVPIGGYSTSPAWQERAYGRISDCGVHSSTFGGGSLACAVARRTLELLDADLLSRVRDVGRHLAERLHAVTSETQRVQEVRGRGLLWGIEFAAPTEGALTLLTLGLPNLLARRLYSHWVALRLLERGFLTETFTHDENVLRVEPALVIEAAEVDRFADALGETLRETDRFRHFASSAGARLVERQLRRGGAPP